MNASGPWLTCGLRAGILLALFAGPSLSADADRVNVVVILADDLGATDLGCYGSTYHRTPNLDRFAATGTRQRA